MGRVTIFTAANCCHCLRAKKALYQREFPYTEICLSMHPDRRNDMLSLSNRLTVPQIFFNDEHIGGADELCNILGGLDKDELGRFREAILNIDGPMDSRLDIPTALSTVESTLASSSWSREDLEGYIEIPGHVGDMVSVMEVTISLMKFMPRHDLKYRARVYKDCFKGRDGVMAIIKKYSLREREEAINFGRSLQRRQILHHVCNDDHSFGETGYFFRLQPYHEPSILNSFRVWTGRVDSDAMRLLKKLRVLLMDNVLSQVANDEGVDYVSAEKMPEYMVFEEAVCELQGVNMASLDEDTKLAFGINLYNLMINHAFIKVGIPGTSVQRGSFFSQVKYNVGGDILSCDELEHGILRANRCAPYHLTAPFSKEDTRRRLSLSKLDPRIHFALNCGARSCPPVRNFTSRCIDEELRIVTQAFCTEYENVHIDRGNCRLFLSMLFHWYRSDFVLSSSSASSSSSLRMAMFLMTCLDGEKKRALHNVIESGKKIEIIYIPYNWSSNASKSKKFDGSRLDPNQITVRAFFSNELTNQVSVSGLAREKNDNSLRQEEEAPSNNSEK